MYWLSYRWILPLVLAIVAGVLVIGRAIQPHAAAIPSDPVAAAWARAREAGSYHFDSDVTQITIPSPKPGNVGRSSRTEQLHLEGQTDLRANTMEMRLWSGGGSVLLDQSGVAVKVEQGKTYTRHDTGDWQAADGLADALAPQGDFMAYLGAVRDVQAHAPETHAGIVVTRYSFTIDGPTFAGFVRDQLQQAMRARGELQPAATIEVPRYYRDMTGDGEIWVDEHGLPIRQILNLAFPEQRDETLNAQIVVDFSQFGAVPAATGTQGFPGMLGAYMPDPRNLAALAATLLMVGMMVRFRRSRRLHKGMAALLIASMLGGPLLQALKIDSSMKARTAAAAERDQRQQDGDLQRSLLEQGDRPAFNPQANPLAAAAPPSYGAGMPSGIPAPLAPANILATDNGVDTDQDGLTDYQEQRAGTDPTFNDSDEDGVPDAIEVRGFQLGGKPWYLDANQADSNGDGIVDGRECWLSPPAAGTPAGQIPACDQDTDSDGAPDLFDADNDNDGVPDRLDLAVFTAGGTTLSESSPFELTLSNLEQDVPTFVDFQLRPANAKHLWFAFNVLDWPHDQEGQIQDDDGKTFADVAAQGSPQAANDDHGDMKLIPMLEMRVQGTPTNLPPQSILNAYNVSVNDYTSDHNTKLVYVPLSIITDEQTGERVAFSARMRSLPSGSWPAPHEVRLAWVVQALIDLPCDDSDPQAVAQGCTDDYIRNVPQVVQTYYDDWRLAGLNVSQNLGAKTAVIYEDPAVDTNKHDDAALVALSHGLDNSFLAGRDQDGDGIRDVDIDEIARRFDHTQNGAVGWDQRWGLDNDLNNLRVERRDYPTFDQATSSMMMTDTLSVLNTQFNSSWTADPTLKPTLMFAYEQRSRALGLDAAGVAGGYVTLSGGNLTVNMQPAGQPKVSINTIAGLKWAHYCRSDSTAAWAVCDAEEYWNELESRYSSIPFPDDPANPDMAAGRMVVTHLYDLALSQGITSVVQQDTTIISGRYSLKTDSETSIAVRNALAVTAGGVKVLANAAILARYVNHISVVEQLGNSIRRLGGGKVGRAIITVKNFKTNRLAATGIVLGAATVIGGLATATYFRSQGNLGAKITLRVFIHSLQAIFLVFDPILALRGWNSALQAAGSTRSLLMSSPEVLGFSKYAGAIGSAIAISVTWGFFIYSMVSNDISPFSPEFNKALAETIAATIYLIVLAILSATVIGTILVGIVTAIDAILTAVCELGVDDLRNVPGLGGACFTLGTTAIKSIAYFLYNYDLMIDTDRNDIVGTGAPITALADPSKGFVAGNALSITMPITTHVVHKNPDPANGIYINFHLWMFSKENLKSSTFKYSLTQPNKQDITGVKRDQMNNDWKYIAKDHTYGANTPMYGGYASTTSTVNGIQLQPGLDQTASFYLNMGYALPAYECWGFILLFIPVSDCSTRTFTNNSSSKIETIKYDIFPATLDGFLALGAKPDGGFGQTWDARFPSLADPDGDGLRSAAHGGLDPNDQAWDNDGDGLSDKYELDRRQDGVAFSAISCDIDDDGLTDGQEAAIGTNPAINDTDNDGLLDGQEVWHQDYDTCAATGNWEGGWDVTIDGATALTVHVSSDPTQADGDGDGISDQAERQLVQDPDPAKRIDEQGVPYNPIVVNTPPISIYTETDRRYIQPGQTLTYTTTVVAHAALAPSVLDVSAPPVLGGSPAPYALGFDPLTFTGAQTITQQTNLGVQPGLNTQTVAVNSSVRARLAPTGPSTLGWDPFTFQSLGTPAQPDRHMRLAASEPDRQDSYLVTTMTSDSTSRGGNGAVLVNAIPGGDESALFSSGNGVDAGDSPSSIACNNKRVCLTVWDQRRYTTDGRPIEEVRGALTQPDGQVQRTIWTGSWSAFRPVVASDGTNFLVAYEVTDPFSPNPTTDIEWVRYDSAGNELGRSSVEIENPRVAARDTGSVGIGLAWIGGRYRLAWKFIRPVPFSPHPSLYVGDIDQNGAMIDSLFNLIDTDLFDNETATPTLAYDPRNDRTLLLYKWANVSLKYVLFQGKDLYAGTKRGVMPGFTLSSRPPRVAYYPMFNAWLLSASGRSTLMSPDLSNVNVLPERALVGNDVPIACPQPSSLPVADLRFEELPGATTFVDSSIYGGNNAACSGSGCPAPGAPGATDAAGIAIGGGAQGPASDYALSFKDATQFINLSSPIDLQGDSFSIAFWYRAHPNSGGGAFMIGETNGYMRLNILPGGNGVLVFLVNNKQVAGPTGLNDGAWHFLVATREHAGNQLKLFVDGAAAPTTERGFSPISPTNSLFVGNNPADLDQLQFYKLPLGADTVKAMYERELQSYCVGVNDNRWAKLSASYPDTRGGKITASGGLTVTIDADQPESMIGGLSDGQYIQGNQIHTIGGDADDDTSPITGVEIDVNDGGWQAASGAATWAYNLAVTEGAYTIKSRATDAAGNLETPGAGITVIADATPPHLTLNALSATPIKPVRNAAGQWTIALNGTVDDPAIGSHAGSGVQPGSVEVLLHGQGGSAQGNGWQPATLDGNNWSLTYTFSAALADPTGGYTVLVRAADQVGNRTPDAGASATLLLDIAGPTATLSQADATRTVISDTLTIGGLITDTANIPASIAGIDKLEIAFTSVEQIAALPSDVTSAEADTLLNRSWLPVAVAQRGAGVATSAWSFQVHSGLENEYQIDLRGTDMLGNVLLISNVWRGVIDTQAPRVVVSGSHDASSWFDLNSGQQMYDVGYTCTATDRYLDEASFNCPANSFQPPARTFDTNPAVQSLFPDRTIVTGLSNSQSFWWPTPDPVTTASACDIFGRCTTDSTSTVASQQAAVQAQQLAPGAPQAVVVAPTRQSYLASAGPIGVTVAAEAGQSLKEVTIALDGTVVSTLSFAQTDAVTHTLRTVPVTVAGEGRHTLEARATDWAGATQSTVYPVNFILDVQAPSVALDTGTLTISDTYQLGSDILRFHGTASDSVGLAAVQIRVGDEPFSDVTFDAGGTWHTALVVPDPEGKTLTVTVRAIDYAGRVAQTSHNLLTDLSAADAPDTTISAGPASPSDVTTASFTFDGTPGGSSVAAFDCQLDDGEFIACASPQSYSELSQGNHTFRVRAIDASGHVDLSPASFSWTVSAIEPESFITAHPSDPTTSRTASFTFSGDSSAASFECALDDGSYTTCASPKQYDNLGDGNHTFRVRARDGAGKAGAAASYSWTVINAAPVASDQSISTPAGAVAAITLAASDTDPLIYKVVNGPAHGVLQGVPPALSYSPDSNFSGTDQFTFVATDGQLVSDPATVTIDVTPINHAPSFTKGPDVTVLEDSGAYNAAWATDISAGPPSESGQTVTFSVTSNSDPGLFSAAPSIAPDGTLSFTPAPNANGSASITVVLKDDGGTEHGAADTSAPQTFIINVTPVNDAPTIALVAGGQCASSSASGTMNLAVADVDRDGLSLGGTSSNTTLVPSSGIVFGGSGASRTVMISAAPARSGSAMITITVSDGKGGSASLAITIRVGTASNEIINGTAGPHMIFGLGGNDTINAGSGSDLLCGGDGNDSLVGGASDDSLDGGAGNDSLAGGAGNDSLSGGAGNDSLSGGAGADFFSGGAGNDSAVDFTPSQGDTRDSTIP